MKKDDILVLGLAGVAAFLVAKAAGLQLPSFGSLTTGAQSFAQSIWTPFSPAPGTAFDPVDPGVYIWNNSLINGAIHDYYTGNTGSNTTPTVQEIFDDVLNGGNTKSILRVDGVWW